MMNITFHNKANSHESFVGPCVILKDHVHPLQLHVQSVPFTTKIVSLILTHGEVYSIQAKVKATKFDLYQDNQC
jgi:phosphatidylserine decarboxylase